MEYKLVPVEPMRAMRKAGAGKWATSDPEEQAACVYRAMLAAAPSPQWVKVSERLPTREDADESGLVWIYPFTSKGVGFCHLSDLYEATHWHPKPRQQPPAPPTAAPVSPSSEHRTPQAPAAEPGGK